jgi:chromosome partitioning protein
MLETLRNAFMPKATPTFANPAPKASRLPIDPAAIKEGFVITVANQKGGSGKTTVSMQLAGALTRNGYKVLVVDADRQNSAIRWSSASDEPFPAAVVNLAEHKNLHSEIARLAKDYHFVLVDCPPSADATATARVLPISTLVIVPLVPSPTDMWATMGIKMAITQAQAMNPYLQARLLINQMQPRTRLARGVLEVVNEFDLPLFETQLHQRTVYREAAMIGSTVFGLQHAEAIAEIEQLTREVLETLAHPPAVPEQQ